jgi:hypothetical protein
MSDPDFSFEAAATHRENVRKYTEDTRRHRIQSSDPNAKKNPRWKVETGDGVQPPLYEVTRDKSGEIVSVDQLRPYPRSDEAETRIKFEVLSVAPHFLGGKEMLHVGPGVLIRCGSTIAYGMHQAGTGKILKEVRP